MNLVENIWLLTGLKYLASVSTCLLRPLLLQPCFDEDQMYLSSRSDPAELFLPAKRALASDLTSPAKAASLARTGVRFEANRLIGPPGLRWSSAGLHRHAGTPAAHRGRLLGYGVAREEQGRRHAHEAEGEQRG